MLLDFRYFFEDVFSEPIPARIGRTNAQEDDNNIPKHRRTNRWSVASFLKETLKKTTSIYQNVEGQTDGRWPHL